MEKQSKTALVTGASGGIGREFARQLAARGYDIVLTSRNKEKLTKLKAEIEQEYGVKCYVMVYDLSKQDSAEKLYYDCKNSYLSELDVLVNNAGAGVCVESIYDTPREANAMLTLNMLSLTDLCILFGKQMADRGIGYILNVSSLNARTVIPYFASYAASKSYVLSYSVALKNELKEKGVVVTCLLPGFVRTNFDENAKIVSSKYKSMAFKSGMQPEKVAAIGLKALFRKKTLVTAGLQNKISGFFSGILPKTLAAKILRNYLAKMVKE